MTDSASIGRWADARRSQRTNMYLAATILAPGFCAPVKIRNMSAQGALVEGPAVPEVTTAIRLVRGQLNVPAIVAWTAPGRAGLRFSSVVSISDWLAPPGHSEQQRVDEVVRLVKAGAVPMPLAASACLQHSSRQSLAGQVGDELHGACRLLEALGDSLSADGELLARHGEELQKLDIAIQTIAAAAELLAGSADEAALAGRLDSLRASSAQSMLSAKAS